MGGTWRKSSYSGANGGDCAEVAAAPGVVLVRDTKDRDFGTLTFTIGAWRRFAEELKRRLVRGTHGASLYSGGPLPGGGRRSESRTP